MPLTAVARDEEIGQRTINSLTFDLVLKKMSQWAG